VKKGESAGRFVIVVKAGAAGSLPDVACNDERLRAMAVDIFGGASDANSLPLVYFTLRMAASRKRKSTVFKWRCSW